MNSSSDERPNDAASSSAATVNYESAPIVEIQVDELDFRVDAGKQGTALCISQRPTGTWDWSFTTEAKWDGSSLRAKRLGRQVLDPLSAALAGALTNQD